MKEFIQPDLWNPDYLQKIAKKYNHTLPDTDIEFWPYKKYKIDVIEQDDMYNVMVLSQWWIQYSVYCDENGTYSNWEIDSFYDDETNTIINGFLEIPVSDNKAKKKIEEFVELFIGDIENEFLIFSINFNVTKKLNIKFNFSKKKKKKKIKFKNKCPANVTLTSSDGKFKHKFGG
jgi:hypothetical protein